MSDNQEVTITVHLVHGEPLVFSVKPSAAKMLGINDDLEQGLHRNCMAIEVDKELLIIPYSNIKYVKVTPAPDGLPLTIIQGAEQIKTN
jgi:hypothetical protein